MSQNLDPFIDLFDHDGHTYSLKPDEQWSETDAYIYVDRSARFKLNPVMCRAQGTLSPADKDKVQKELSYEGNMQEGPYNIHLLTTLSRVLTTASYPLWELRDEEGKRLRHPGTWGIPKAQILSDAGTLRAFDHYTKQIKELPNSEIGKKVGTGSVPSIYREVDKVDLDGLFTRIGYSLWKHIHGEDSKYKNRDEGYEVRGKDRWPWPLPPSTPTLERNTLLNTPGNREKLLRSQEVRDAIREFNDYGQRSLNEIIANQNTFWQKVLSSEKRKDEYGEFEIVALLEIDPSSCDPNDPNSRDWSAMPSIGVRWGLGGSLCFGFLDTSSILEYVDRKLVREKRGSKGPNPPKNDTAQEAQDVVAEAIQAAQDAQSCATQIAQIAQTNLSAQDVWTMQVKVAQIAWSAESAQVKSRGALRSAQDAQTQGEQATRTALEVQTWTERAEQATKVVLATKGALDALAQTASFKQNAQDALAKIKSATSSEQAVWYVRFAQTQATQTQQFAQETQTRAMQAEQLAQETQIQIVLTQMVQAAQNWATQAAQTAQDAQAWNVQIPTTTFSSQPPIVAPPSQVPSQQGKNTAFIPQQISPTRHRSSISNPWMVLAIIVALLVVLGSAVLLYVSNAHQIAVSNAMHATATTEVNNTATAQAAQATDQANTATATAQAIDQANTATAQAIQATDQAATQAAYQATADAQAQATANAAATATAIAYNPYPPNTGTLVINDPLSDNSMGYQWDESPTCVFTNGAYQVSTSADVFSTCTAQATNFTSNFVYQVDITIIQGCGGITFFSQGDNFNYTTFEVCQDGSSNISVCEGNSTSSDCSGGGNIPPNSAIQTGSGQSNTLAVVYANDSLSFYVNQQLLQTAGPAMVSVTGGKIGVLANIPSTGGYGQVTCSNVKVWTL